MKNLILMIASIAVVFSMSVSKAFVPAGTATAYGREAPKGATCLEIKGTRATGTLKVKKVEVIDKFGRPKRVDHSVITGSSSSNPKIKFTPALEEGDNVSVELETYHSGDHGILDTRWC